MRVQRTRVPRLARVRSPLARFPSGHGLDLRECGLAIALVALCTLSACTSSPSPASPAEQHEPGLGAFSPSGPTFGQQALAPTRCSVGQREWFLGFDLHDNKAGFVTRLVIDPATGPVVRVYQASAPFDRSILFHRSDCSVFHFSIDSTGWLINDIYKLKVSLELDCRLPTGDSIVGKAQDNGCL